MMFYLSPTSAHHAGFPFPPQFQRTRSSPFDYYHPPTHDVHHHHSGYPHFPFSPVNVDVDVDAAVERAAREYAIAQRRVQAVERERLRRMQAIEQHRRRLAEQRRARAEAQAQALTELAVAMEQLTATAQQTRRRAQMYEEYERAKVVEAARLHATFRRQQEAEMRRREEAQKAFLDAVRFHNREHEEPRRVPAMSRPIPSPEATSPQERLLRRLAVDEDAEVQEVIENLLNLFSHTPGATSSSQKQEAKQAETPAKQDKGKARESPAAFPWEKPVEKGAESKNTDSEPRTVHFKVPISSTTPAVPRQTSPPISTPAPAPTQTEHTNLHRAPAIRRSTATQLSLGAIDRISGLLQDLKGSFVFPSDLDHTPLDSRTSTPSPTSDSDSTQLPFTSKNKPVHIYEHALNGLLAKLDEVDSHGDEEVRRRRKEVVLEVEKALEDVDRKVAEASPKAEQSKLPDESELVSVSAIPEEGAAIQAGTENKPEVAEEVAIAPSTEFQLPSTHVSEASDSTTSRENSTDPVSPVVESEAVLDTAPVTIEADSEGAPVSSDVHTDTIATSNSASDEGASGGLSDGGSTIVQGYFSSSSDESLPELQPELKVLPPAIIEPDVPAIAAGDEAIPAAPDTPAQIPVETFNVEEVEVVETQDPSPATTLETAADASHSITSSEPTTTPTDEAEDDKRSTIVEDIRSPAETESDASAFLLQSHQQEDPTYVRAKARAASNKEGEADWEVTELSSVSDVDVDGETWSEIE